MNNSSKYENISPLSARLEILVGNTFRSDFTFIIEDDNAEIPAEIPAHKLIIALASPVLDIIVYGNETFLPADSVKVDGICKESFMQILHYIYTDKIDINDDNVFEILNKSNYFGLAGIEMECFEYLENNLSASTVPWIYHQLFYTFPSSNLLKKCQQYIQIQPSQFFSSEYFEKISVDELKSILQLDAINCTEIDLFEAMINLSRAQCTASDLEVTGANQRKVLDGAEKLLRLESVTEIEFDKCLAIQKDFFTSNEIERIRSDIQNGVKTVVKRKWYTYEDAVWIEIFNPNEMPSSSFYSDSELFIYRCCKDDLEPQVSGDYYKLSAGDVMQKMEVLCGSGYEWRKCVNGEIPFGSVSITKNHSEPMFIARGKSSSRRLYIGPSYINGKMVIREELETSWSYSIGEDIDASQQLSEFEILVANNVKNPYNGSGVPNDAIFVGYDDDNSKIYLGRAWHGGDLLPAILRETDLLPIEAFVPFNAKAQQVDEFDFVRMDPGTYKWEEGNGGEVPANAIIGGCTLRGETLYFGRALLHGNYVPGKVHPSHKLLYCPYRMYEINFRSYEVLVQIKDDNVIC